MRAKSITPVPASANVGDVVDVLHVLDVELRDPVADLREQPTGSRCANHAQ
jgi:hypothetical protein